MLARNMGVDVVAEGIETEQQLASLRDLKCEYGQGFLFSHPPDADTAATQLEGGDAGRGALLEAVRSPQDFS